MSTPLIRSQSCPNLRREISEPETPAGKLNERHVENNTPSIDVSALTIPAAATVIQQLADKYATPVKVQDVESELNAKMKMEKLPAGPAYAKLQEEDPEMAFRMWCDYNGKNVPKDLTEDPEQSYLLACEYQQITPDIEQINQFHEMTHPTTVNGVIEKAHRVVEHSRTTREEAQNKLAALQQKIAARKTAEGA